MTVHTECAHCGTPLTLEIDSELNYRVEGSDGEPLVFVPDVDLFKLKEDSIVESF
ncbi:MAG: hypothetical protein V1816_14875 [Pseudomonadota bacterium]